MLRIKYFLFITLAIFCTSVCYFCLSYYNEFRNFAEQNVVKELYFEQAFVENNIQNQFYRAVDGTIYASLQPIIKDAFSKKNFNLNATAIKSELEKIEERTEAISNMSILDENGALIFNASSSGKSTSINNYWAKKNVRIKIASIIRDIKDFNSKHNTDILNKSFLVESKGVIVKEVDGKQDIVYLYPIVKHAADKSLELLGFILTEIPFSFLSENTNLSDYSKSIIKITDYPIFEKEKCISRSNIISFRDLNGKEIVSVYVSVFYPVEFIEERILNSIMAQVRTNIFISSVIGISLIICFLFILHSFGKLFWYIGQVERNNTVFPAKFWIWEFGKTSSLLHRMKQTILAQIKDIEIRNKNLEQANAEVEEANHKLADMNNSLEGLVNERTVSLQNALELSNNCNNISNVIINQRTHLNDTMQGKEIFDIFLKSIKQFNLKRDFKFFYRIEGEEELSYSSISEEINGLEGNVDDSYRFENGYYWFPLCLKEGSGNLVIKSKNASIENDILTNISVFCRDVASYLDNYILRRRLSFWARTDGLTKLGNRVAYDQEISYYENALDLEYGLFLVDVNGLKEINDKKGHTYGDALLKRVAEKLHIVFDKYHSNIFRIGGDEYTVILKPEFLDDSDKILQELKDVQDDYDAYVKSDRSEICATFAVGFADSRRVPYQMMYKIADREMYLQKQEHYDRCYKLYGEIRKPRH